MPDLDDAQSFLAVCRAGGFREAARSTHVSASGLSEAVRRLEARGYRVCVLEAAEVERDVGGELDRLAGT